MLHGGKLTSASYFALLAVLMLAMANQLSLNPTNEGLNEGFSPLEIDGRQSPEEQLAEECEGITFEDMFVYTHGLFDITINDDWKSADIWGWGWTNGSEAAEVRKDIDELMTNIPGNQHSAANPTAQGGDDKYSTDERDALESIGPACVERTSVRFGLNDVVHREGDEWNNMSWIGDSLKLSDEQMECVQELGNDWESGDCPITSVEAADSTYGDCSEEGRGDGDCQWVDVTSERNFILWVHGTTTFSKIDHNSFTLAINATNMSSGTVRVTFPTTDSALRQGGMMMNIDCEASGTGVDDVLYHADCQGSTTETYSTTSRMVNGGMNYQFETDVTYDFPLWPATKHIFFDFTTAEPEINDPPEWTAAAPANGTLIPVLADGEEQVLIIASLIDSWYSDDYSAAQIQCDLSGWNANIDAQGDYVATPPVGSASTSMACELVDGSAQLSEQRSFIIAQPLSISSTTTEAASSIDIDVTALNDISGIDFEIVLSQDESAVSSDSLTLAAGTETVTISTANLRPGAIEASVVTSGTGVLTRTLEFNLGLTKANNPPLLTIDGYEWLDRDGDTISDTYTMWGTFSDPDGESVQLTIETNNQSAGGITITGANWEADGIAFYLYDEGEFTITIEACDTSGGCTSVERSVTNLFWEVDDVSDSGPAIEDDAFDDEGLLPAPNVFFTCISVALALFVISRRDENEETHL